MATDTRADTSLTLADLCQAIADGNLPYALHDDHYYVKAHNVRHMRSTKPAPHNAQPPDILIEHSTVTSSLNIGCSA